MCLKNTDVDMQCSYSKKAYPWDNACIESFHSLIKREWLNRFKIRDYNHAYRLVFEYLEAFYNTKRVHSHCDYMSPNEYEELYHKLQQDELNAGIAAITANIDSLKADLKIKKSELKSAEKEVAKLEAKKGRSRRDAKEVASQRHEC